MPLQVLRIYIFIILIVWLVMMYICDKHILMDYSIVHYRNKLGFTTIIDLLIGLKYN